MLDLVHEWLSPNGILAMGLIWAAIEARLGRHASLRNARALEAVKARVEEVQISANGAVALALRERDARVREARSAGVAEGIALEKGK